MSMGLLGVWGGSGGANRSRVIVSRIYTREADIGIIIKKQSYILSAAPCPEDFGELNATWRYFGNWDGIRRSGRDGK